MRLNPHASGVPPNMPIDIAPPPAMQLTQCNLDLYAAPASIIHYLHPHPDSSYGEDIDRNAPPPSYDSLFGQMRKTRKSRNGLFDFFRNVLILLLGSICCTIILGIAYIIPISMIVIGSLYLYDCPQGEYIPFYLIVGGAFALFRNLLCICSGRRPLSVPNEEIIHQSSVETLIDCFLFVWFIFGSIWVYKEYEPNYDPSLGKYCNKTLYLFSFWLITVSCCVCLVLCLFICLFNVYKRLLSSESFFI